MSCNLGRRSCVSVSGVTSAQFGSIANPPRASWNGVIEGAQEKIAGHAVNAVAVELLKPFEDVLGEGDGPRHAGTTECFATDWCDKSLAAKSNDEL